MKILRSLQILSTKLRRNKKKRPLHTPEELTCFKQDAIHNHKKHYRLRRLSEETEHAFSNEQVDRI